jgi:endonuclease/exonuclease/phosphatase family metal-dependent hydrolase
MRFRVITWNCFGMAQGALDAVLGRRAPAGLRLQDPHILAECLPSDVFCMQEILSRDAEQLFDRMVALSQGASLRDHNRLHLRSRTARGSGLGLWVRGELVSPTLHPFSGPATSWDKLARKGALVSRVTLSRGFEVDVITTHLQAGYEPAAAVARTAQLEQLGRLIAEVSSPDRPLIVAGDFNIDGLAAARSDPEYLLLRRTLEGFEDTGAATDLVTFHPHPEFNSLAHGSDPGGRVQRLDYVFFRPARHGRAPLRSVGVRRILDEPLVATTSQDFAGLRSAEAYASDHFGLAVDFELSEA